MQDFLLKLFFVLTSKEFVVLPWLNLLVAVCDLEESSRSSEKSRPSFPECCAEGDWGNEVKPG